jgi:chaperonin GroES
MDIKEILKISNLAEELEDDKLTEIGNQVVKRFNDDKQSRSDKLKTLEEIVKLSLSITDEKSFPWPGASNTIFPLISTAVMDFGSKCSPEILRDDFIVKAKVIGKDDGTPLYSVGGEKMINPETNEPILKDVSAKQKRGDRVSTVMNYQLTESIDNWCENTDKLTISLAATGTMFRKTFYNGKKIVSELIYPDKLFVHDQTVDFDLAPKTHVQELYDVEIQRKIRSGFFKEFVYSEESSDSVAALLQNDLSNSQNEGSNDTNSGLHIFLEQCCWLDLDEDGLDEPYVVTAHQSSNTVVRIAPLFDKSDIEKEGDKIISISYKNPYTVFNFIPSPDGSFYGVGLGHLLFNINKGVNSSINQLTDAGTLQNTGGGFIAKSLKIRGGAFKMKPNEYKMVDSFGSSIRDSIVSLPTPEPSQTLFALLGFLTQAGKELGSLKDSLTGENAANVQATTMMALVEQGITQFRSIYKRIYRSLKKEFKLIYSINGKHLSQKEYADILDEAIAEVDVKADFSKGGFDIVPVADGASITNTQRVAKAGFLMQFMNDPFTDQILLRQRILSGFGIENYQELVTSPPPAQPDANTILAQAEMMKAENRIKEIQIKAIETSSKIQEDRIQSEKTLSEIKEIESKVLKNIADATSKELENAQKIEQSIEQNIRANINNEQV